MISEELAGKTLNKKQGDNALNHSCKVTDQQHDSKKKCLQSSPALNQVNDHHDKGNYEQEMDQTAADMDEQAGFFAGSSRSCRYKSSDSRSFSPLTGSKSVAFSTCSMPLYWGRAMKSVATYSHP
jgi:hypothetical protein